MRLIVLDREVLFFVYRVQSRTPYSLTTRVHREHRDQGIPSTVSSCAECELSVLENL